MKSYTDLTYLKMMLQTRRSQWRFLNAIMQQFEGTVGGGEDGSSDKKSLQDLK